MATPRSHRPAASVGPWLALAGVLALGAAALWQLTYGLSAWTLDQRREVRMASHALRLPAIDVQNQHGQPLRLFGPPDGAGADAPSMSATPATPGDENDVPLEGRFVVVPSWFHGLLLKDERFVNAGTRRSDAALANGEVGEAAGFAILKSNNVPNDEGEKYGIIAGHSMATSYVEQIVDLQTYKPEKRFGDKFILVAGHTIPLIYTMLAAYNTALRARYDKTGDQRFAVPDAEHKQLLPKDLTGFRRRGGLAGHAEDQTLAPILVGMFVDEGMRRCGIGEALVEAIKSWARSGGHDTLHLWVVSTNTPALALYRRCGFVASGRSRPVAHTPALTELHMLVDLGPN